MPVQQGGIRQKNNLEIGGNVSKVLLNYETYLNGVIVCYIHFHGSYNLYAAKKVVWAEFLIQINILRTLKGASFYPPTRMIGYVYSYFWGVFWIRRPK